MRRFAVAVIAVAGLSVPAPAAAHTLPFASARAEATSWARTLAAATQSRALVVSGCLRLNRHTVKCNYRMDGPGAGGVIPTTVRCTGFVQVRYVGTTVLREIDNPTHRCAVL